MKKDGEFTSSGIQKVLLLNSAVMMGGKVLGAVVSILMVPLIISDVGVEGYGTWEAILAFAMFGGLFQNAITGTLLWRASGEFANDDYGGMVKTLRMGIAVTGVELALVAIPFFMFRKEIVELLNIPGDHYNAAIVVLPVTAIIVMIGGLNECFGALIGSCQKSGAMSIVQTVSQLFNYAVVIICLANGLALYSMMYGMLAAALFTLVLLYFLTKKLIGKVSIVPLAPGKEEIKNMWKYFRSMSIGSVAIALRGQITKILTATVASPAWTGYYGIANRLAATVLLMLSFFSLPAVSAFGVLHAAKNKWNEIRTLYLNMTVIVCLLSGYVALIVGCLYDRIMVLWLGNYIPEVAPMLITLVVTNAIITMLTGIGSSLCKGIGRPEVETRYVIVGLVLNVVFLFVFIKYMGAFGAVVASSLSYVLSGMYFVPVLHKEFDLPKRSLYVIAATSAAILLTTLAVRYAARFFPLVISRPEALVSGLALGSAATAGYLFLMGAFRVVDYRKLFKNKLYGRQQ